MLQMKRILFAGSFLLLGIGMFWFYSANKDASKEITSNSEAPCEAPCEPGNRAPVEMPAGSLQKKTIHVTAYQWGYDMESVDIVEGDTVEVILTSSDVPHSFSMGDFGEFGINEVAMPGNETRFEFVADKVGDFMIACDIFCGREHREMLATLTVKKRSAI